MKSSTALFLFVTSSFVLSNFLNAQQDHSYALYPEVNDLRPDLSSPFPDANGHEFVVAVTKDEKFAVMDVTLSNTRKICPQLIVDSLDFPELLESGLHSEEDLQYITTITGRPVSEITRLALPGGLSTDGFLAIDENIVAVIKGDNRLVRKMGLTHAQMARPLFHVLNMMDNDLKLDRWNMARHRWDNIRYFYYHGNQINIEAYDTKGGQQSIFDDGIQGAFYIKIWREPQPEELAFLNEKYSHLSAEQRKQMIALLTLINTGEIEPQYIMRYGFYEGHTSWRTDPVAIAYIFGLRSPDQIEAAFPGALYDILNTHFSD